MDDDSCGKFIGSLTKYLQSLCHSYVDFKNGVELVGHIYLNVDTGKKIDYVLNESVCKNGANVVKFTSNSYHAQPVEKKDKKETPKKDPPKDSKKNDDDDVIIVGSEGSRRNRTPGSSPSRSHASPNQMQRGVGLNRMGQGGMFRSPRGPNPRFGGPVPRAGGYTYQPRQRLTYPQQPRNYLNVGAGYSPRMRQPYQPRATQPIPVRGTTPVDTDVTFMREEYVAQPAGQTATSTANQPGYQAPFQQPQQAQQSLQVQQQPGQVQQAAAGQVFPVPYSQTTATPSHPTSMAVPLTAPTTLGVAVTTGQPGSSVAAGQEGTAVGVVPGTVDPSIFQQSQPAAASVSGGMPLPVTTHTIFDSGPVMSSGDMPNTQLQVGEVGNTSDPLAPSVSAEGSVPVSSAVLPTSGVPLETQQNLLIGQVWSESNAGPDPSATQQTPAQSVTAGTGSFPALGGKAATTLASLPSVDSTSSVGQPTSGLEVFGQQMSAETTKMSQPPSSAPFSPTLSTTNSTTQNNTSSSADGDGFSALVSELQAFNQQPNSQPFPSSQPAPSSASTLMSHPPVTSSTGNATQSTEDSHTASQSVPRTLESIVIKKDPGVKTEKDISANIATSVLHESAEAAANQAPETFLTSMGMSGTHGGPEGFKRHSASTSSHSQGSSSPSSGNLVGPESVVIETKPFLHTSDYDSGCDSTSTSTGERPASHSQMRSMPNTSSSTAMPTITVKKERPSEDEVPPESVKRAQSEWQNKDQESDWVTDMSALNNSDDSMDSDSDTAQDDDDPNYTPGRPIEGVDKGRRKKVTRRSNVQPPSVPEIKKEIPDPIFSAMDGSNENTVIDILDSDENENAEEEAGREGWGEETRDEDATGEDEDSLTLPAVYSPKKRKTDEPGFRRKVWTEQEKSAVETHFRMFIEEQKLPGKVDIETVIKRESVLQGRSWHNIKDYLRNSHLASAKRTRSKQIDKGSKGKRRKLDTPEPDVSADGGGDEQPPSISEASAEEDTDLPLPDMPAALDSDQQPEEDMEGLMYKPGTFVLVNTNKDTDRPSRTRHSLTPAEVIVTPEGQEDGVWVHVLVPAQGGLWRLPNVDQLVDLRLDPADIVKTLEKAQVKIVGSKVFYKFDDIGVKQAASKHKRKK